MNHPPLRIRCRRLATFTLSSALGATVPVAADVTLVTDVADGGFSSLPVHEDWEAFSPKNVWFTEGLTSNGIDYVPTAGLNVGVASPGYVNFGIDGPTRSSILTANGNEDFVVHFDSTVRRVGFSCYTNNEPGNPNSVDADDLLISVTTASGTTVFEIAPPPGNLGFAGFLSDEPILSLTWTADRGDVVNTGLDDLRLSDSLEDCPSDVDGDGTVDFDDVVLLLAAWGPCPGGGPCPADVDATDAVDFNDLVIVLAAWGECT